MIPKSTVTDDCKAGEHERCRLVFWDGYECDCTCHNSTEGGSVQ